MYKTIGLVIRPDNALATETAQRLLEHIHVLGLKAVVSSRDGEPVNFDPELFVPLGKLSEHCDLAIVIGGDGSLLGAARALSSQSIPVLGVNRGSLGFLTDISPEDAIFALDEALAGRGIEDRRHLLGVTVIRDNHKIASGTALNDVVLHKGSSARMLGFSVSVDGTYVYDAMADGLIIATPTGSTAYSLSAGGPMLHPSLPALVITPMFPHTLTHRPLVISDQQTICLSVRDQHQSLPLISCDGQTHITVMPGDSIQVERLDQALVLLHVDQDYDYYQVCREKLGWASRLVD